MCLINLASCLALLICCWLNKVAVNVLYVCVLINVSEELGKGKEVGGREDARRGCTMKQ